MRIRISKSDIDSAFQKQNAYHLERYGSELDEDDIIEVIIYDDKVVLDVIALSGHSDSELIFKL